MYGACGNVFPCNQMWVPALISVIMFEMWKLVPAKYPIVYSSRRMIAPIQYLCCLCGLAWSGILKQSHHQEISDLSPILFMNLNWYPSTLFYRPPKNKEEKEKENCPHRVIHQDVSTAWVWVHPLLIATISKHVWGLILQCDIRGQGVSWVFAFSWSTWNFQGIY